MFSAAALRRELQELEGQAAAAAAARGPWPAAGEPKGGPLFAASEDWQADFEDFLSQQWEAKQVRKHLLAGAVAFLRHKADEPLSRRVEFLRYKGLTSAEMADVFAVAGQQAEWEALARPPAAPPSPGEVPTAAIPAAAATATPRTPFRVGMHVYAYLDRDRYFPAVVSQIDESRHADILKVTFEFCRINPMSEKSLWRVEGFKGVVADVLPMPEVFSDGQAVVFAKAGDEEDVMYDAILRRCLPDGRFELEHYTVKGEVRTIVPLDALRSLQHPYLLATAAEAVAHRRSREADHQRRQFFSSQAFPIDGEKERSVLLSQQGPEPITAEERTRLGQALPSFQRYPTLRDLPPLPGLNTFNYFAGVYCKIHGPKMWWVKDAVEGVGKGFGFDTSHLQRHPRCPHLFTYNPILEVAAQCLAKKSQFVDPDFPPLSSSIYRYPVPYGAGWTPPTEELPNCPKEYEWRRASELLARPRPVIDARELVCGELSQDWLAQAFGIWTNCLEFQESISPKAEASPFGAYTVRLFVDGRWYFVLVDDFLPVKSEGLVAGYMQSRNVDEMWPALLEKVYAKLRGSYEALMEPSLSWSPEAVLADLTGTLAEVDDYTLLSEKEAWFENLRARLAEPAGCFVLSTVNRTRKAVKKSVLPSRAKGLRVGAGECYKVVAVQALWDDASGTRYPVVLIEHPWSFTQMEAAERAVFFEDWPKGVVAEVEELQRREAGRPHRHWVPLLDYMAAFCNAVSCHLFHYYQRAAVCRSFAGTCGGSKWDNSNTRWCENPQLFVNLSSHGTFSASLRLTDRRFNPVRPNGRVMQLSLLRAVDGRERLTSADSWLTSSNVIDFEDAYSSACPVVWLTTELPAGQYVLIPEVGTFDSTEDFVLQVWSDVPFNGQMLDPP
eukprot:EG_transcript_2039